MAPGLRDRGRCRSRLCLLFGNGSDPYNMLTNAGTKLDLWLFGEKHLYHGEGVAFDPEGIMSTLSAIVEVIFGYLVGDYIQKKGKNFEMLSGLFVAGVAMILTGFCWDMVFPLNKKIWTSSYSIYTTGLALLILSMMIYLLDFKNAKGWWSRFFDVFGKNALFIFAIRVGR